MLRRVGLKGHVIGGLLRAYAHPPSQYPLRLGAATTMTARAYDVELRRVGGGPTGCGIA